MWLHLPNHHNFGISDIFYPEAIYPITQRRIVGFLLSKDLLNRQKGRFYATHRFSRKNFNPSFQRNW